MTRDQKQFLTLFFNVLDLLPLALEVFLPQADLVVTATDSENVAAKAPADTPENGIKLECLAGPLTRVGSIGGPDANSLILRSRGDVRLGQNAR